MTKAACVFEDVRYDKVRYIGATEATRGFVQRIFHFCESARIKSFLRICESLAPKKRKCAETQIRRRHNGNLGHANEDK